jgi:nucleotide-binding universal stress UspA family protein
MIPKTIVVPLDGSPLAEHALDVARPLATRLGSDVVAVTTTWNGDAREPGAYLDEVIAQSGNEAVKAIVVENMFADAAIRQVAAEQPDSMVCMTTHGRGRLRWAAVGSVAEDVIRESTDPLLLVGPRANSAWTNDAHRVVVCIDGTSADLASTRHACEWAKVLDLEVELACVYHPLDLEAEHADDVFGPPESIVKAAGLRVRRHQLFRSSFVAGALVDCAEDRPATMIVMAAHHHGVLARIALGSTTMATVHLAQCPVLVVPAAED